MVEFCRRGGLAALLSAALLGVTACGGGGGSTPATSASSTSTATAAPASPAVPQRTAPMSLLIPLYAYPLVSSGSGTSRITTINPAWQAVAAGAAAVPTVAVINPSNGPVACSSPPSATLTAFTQGIAQLHAAGARVLGYVHTSYGQRALASVQQDVQTYAQCYGVDGIFFDEVAVQPGQAGYYAAAAAAARSAIVPLLGQTALVVINPGAYPDPSIAATADVTVVHESADLNQQPVPASLAAYAPSRFAYLAFGIGSLAQVQSAVLSGLFAQGIGYVDLTDQGSAGTNPWANVSSVYPDLIQAVQALNQTLQK
ncbi:spherulation-specific family 4 protein [Thiomonas sp.]|jgi:hypothetical protein|uniref:spherulation-specific family 4 protein n=1 Tax=Thiomonas sp. TaxID=2047785 RepID=UPI0026254B51|nr:spherulation-specific family 4 protein [Thiomonas sp.]